jgi:hypothetical protein
VVDWHALVGIGSLVTAWCLGYSMALQNLKDEKRREANLIARKAYKREKNKRMAAFYGIDYRPKD